ncbi:MAG TPA: hypothetical protein VF266_20815 [Thermoanaerobaculia bacterium]
MARIVDESAPSFRPFVPALRHFAITLDQQNQRVRFTGSPAVIAQPPSLRSFGLSVQSSSGKVTSVREGTPAARAGV